MHLQVQSVATMQDEFLRLLPAIEKAIGWVLLACPRAERDEARQEATALAWKHFRSLAERGKNAAAFPAVIGRWAAKHVLSGRRLAGGASSKDVLSRTAGARRGFSVAQLDGRLAAALAPDVRTNVATHVAFRIDFPEWLSGMSRRDRKIAADLAAGHSTNEVARKYDFCAARVSQKRREFAKSWQRFQCEVTEGAQASA